MSTLSEQERLHHFRNMKVGTANGPFEMAPWQTAYTSNDAHDEKDVVEELTARLSRTLDTVKDVIADSIVPSHHATPFSHLRMIDALSTDIAQIRHFYDLALHKLRCQVFASNALVAPITRIPDDIMAMVFEAAADPLRKESRFLYYLLGSNTHSNHRPSQITIAAVCSKWRKLAHNTPELWGTMIINETLVPEAVDEWCLRGKNAPLDLVLTLQNCMEEARSHKIAFLNRVSHRLRSLKLLGHLPSLDHAAEEWSEPAPHLQKYEVEHNGCACTDVTTSRHVTTVYIRDPSSLPALRSFTIYLLSPWRTVPTFEGCFSGTLEVLSLRFTSSPLPDLGATLRLLAGVPALRLLRLLGVKFCDKVHTEACPTIDGLDAVVLHQLRTLEITSSYNYSCNSAICYKWLPLLDAPKLQTINVNNSQLWQREICSIDRQLTS
ncbi:hypothetical protein CALVIDRAFT_542615 [Calocera viscosa TUFC12733]|uniref:Uncharacterized protein n=1 Tax=Calocera viscosa (strain TUFC12733) TaxID=1330018 RepID=A0A167GFB0_CALVF|nr:hypothetical protein CALVIDRAFT_542615 [Calocera viscosa TUFC12733]